MSTLEYHPPAAETAVERLEALPAGDLQDLCDAAEAAIEIGGGFGWLDPPPREVMESYWRGVVLIRERQLFVGRLDGVIAGSAQLQLPGRNNEAQSCMGQLSTAFVAPWARGYGLARALALAVEGAARAAGLMVLNLDVRGTQTAAIKLYESLGFERWGTMPRYALVDGGWVAGHFYSKDLAGPVSSKDPAGPAR